MFFLNIKAPQESFPAGPQFFEKKISVIYRLVGCSLIDCFDFLAGSLGCQGYNDCDDETADESGNDLVNAGVGNDSRADRAREKKEPCDIDNCAADDAGNSACIVKALPEQ